MSSSSTLVETVLPSLLSVSYLDYTSGFRLMWDWFDSPRKKRQLQAYLEEIGAEDIKCGKTPSSLCSSRCSWQESFGKLREYNVAI